MPNFRPVLNILRVDFVPGEKQSQLLDLSLGLGLEFDKKKEKTKNAENSILCHLGQLYGDEVICY